MGAVLRRWREMTFPVSEAMKQRRHRVIFCVVNIEIETALN